MKKRKNILWIGTDEHHRGTIGAYGATQCQTPRLDRLASESKVFDQAFCPSAVCAPSRAGILSGKLPGEGSVISNNPMEFSLPCRDLGEKRPLTSWAQALKQTGYRSVHIGKWHVTHDCHPSDYGFEGPDWPGYGPFWRSQELKDYRENLGLTAEVELEDELNAVHPHEYCFDPIAARLRGPEEGSLPAFLSSMTRDYIKELGQNFLDNEQPFFLRCEFWGPHIQCVVPEPYFSMYDPDKLELPPHFNAARVNKPEIQDNFSGCMGIATHDERGQRELISRYMGYVTQLDTEIGKILDYLDEMGLAEDTIVVFTSDHGDMLGAHGLYDKGPFMYDDIYRIPLMVRCPGMIAPGRSDALVYNMDAGAMIWDLIDEKNPAPGSAKSLLPVLTGEKSDLDRELIISEFYCQHDFFPQVMVHSGNDKFIYNFAATDEYYDLTLDPYELDNRIGDPTVRERILFLREHIYQWMREIHSPMLHAFERTSPGKLSKLGA